MHGDDAAVEMQGAAQYGRLSAMAALKWQHRGAARWQGGDWRSYVVFGWVMEEVL